MSTHRLARVAKELQRELSQLILYELRQPNLGFITITRVEPTSDLQYAKVFITVLGDENKRKTSLELLNKASGYIHRVLGKRIRMRYIPRLSFHFDDTVEKERRILTRDWSKYTLQECVFKPKNMSTDELDAGLYWLNKESYNVFFCS